MSTFKAILFAFVAMIVGSASVYAQASVGGIVRDTSGAVLPGVTVEAASPALIERVRSAVTDGAGQYRIVDLRPGTYSVTATLSGFNTVRREGIELSGSFAASLNFDLPIGAVSETVTVTGESPIVDVRTPQSEQRISSDVIASIPTGRQYFSLIALVPTIAGQGTDVGGSAGPSFSQFRQRGGGMFSGELQVNGYITGWQGYGISYYVADINSAQEVIVSTNPGMGEVRTDGPIMNVIPRSGGNMFKGSFYVNGANGAMEGANFTEEHRRAGLSVPNQLQKIWDVDVNYGGPILLNRIWFFSSVRHQGNRKTVAGMWANLNAGDPTKWTYEPDLSKQATETGDWFNAAMHFTVQPTPRNRFNLFWDDQIMCRLCKGGEGSTTAAPEAIQTNEGKPLRIANASWTSPLSSAWLAEGGVGLQVVQWGGSPKEPQDTTNLIRVVEQAGLIPGMAYRSTNWNRPAGFTWSGRGSVSRVTGSHTTKVGFMTNYYSNRTMDHVNRQLLEYRFNNGVPNQLTMRLQTPIVSRAYTNDYSAYGQDSWTRGRLTLQGGLRYEYISSGFPATRIDASKFLTKAIEFPAAKSPLSLHDLSPRFGAAYDLFGDGKTALKATLGRYPIEPSGSNFYANAYSPIVNIQTRTDRSWNDANRNFVPDCNLLDPNPQDLRATGGDSCGAWSNAAFGTAALTTRFAPDVVGGLNSRLSDWNFTAAVRHEIFARVGLQVEYARRIFANFKVTDNLAVGPQDFGTFSVVAPSDPRLPNGGGNTISGLKDVNPAKFGVIDNLVTLSDNYGKMTRHYDGISATVDARTTNGLTLQGGFNVGRTLENDCEVLAALPELRPLSPYCDVRTPFLANYSGLASYTIPRIDVQVAGTFYSKPFSDTTATINANYVDQESLNANAVVPNAQIVSSLGRNLSGGVANASINLVEPGKLYGDRITSVDFRVAKVFRFDQRRLMIGLDLYNAANSGAVVTLNQTYGASFLAPRQILQPRFAKISAQLDF